ncbi:MAG: GntR family transcriptional regulator, partial [Bacteroidales bacterium]
MDRERLPIYDPDFYINFIVDSYFPNLKLMISILAILKDHIEINHDSIDPKYLQIANKIVELIKQGFINKGDKLPPINKVYSELKVSRDTLI